MNGERFRLVESWFDRVLEIPLAQRRSYLDEQVDDPELRAELVSLLDAHERESGALERLQSTSLPSALESVLGRGLEGTTIGAFRLEQVLAVGGSGVVYRAAAHDGTKVALKLLRLSSGDAVRRFRHEVEILRRLRHPAIAAVHDSGFARIHAPRNARTDVRSDRDRVESCSGRIGFQGEAAQVRDAGQSASSSRNEAGEHEVPWLAMELVEDATPLDRYVAARVPGREARIRLFEQVCAGVEHAHRHGVIHRDLKPDNVLVGADGAPKIVDFGLARPEWADSTRATHTGQVFGTLRYMSPEHLAGTLDRVEVRSDVYSLGVMLYELLLGRSPYAAEGRGPLAMLAAVRDAEVTPPRTLDRSLPHDLERILLAALRRDPALRTPSATALQADLARARRGEPIALLEPSWWRELAALARRHRRAAAVAAVMSCSLLLGAGGLLWGFGKARGSAREAEDRAAEAEAIHEFLTDMLSTEGRASASWRVREVIDRAAARMTARFAGRPWVLATVHRTVGRSYEELGALLVAREHLREAYALRRVHARTPDDEAQREESALELALLLQELGEVREAGELLDGCLTFRTSRFGQDDPRTLEARHHYAVWAYATAAPAVDPIERMHEVWERRNTAHGSLDSRALESAAMLAQWLQYAGRHGEALAVCERVTEAFEEQPERAIPERGALGPRDLAPWRERQAHLYALSGEWARAEVEWKGIVSFWEREGDGERAARSRMHRAFALLETGQDSLADVEARLAIEYWRQRHGHDAESTLEARLQRIQILARTGLTAAALAELDNVQTALLRGPFPFDHALNRRAAELREGLR